MPTNMLQVILHKLSNQLVAAVILVSVVMSLTNSAPYFTGIVNTPKDKVYLGTTHFPMDYFLYLNHFFQGAHGAWLTVNKYTSEPTPPSILYWSDVLMGKIGGVIGLAPDVSYNLSVTLLAFLVIISTALMLNKIFPTKPLLTFIGFIYATFATSLMNHIYVKGEGMWFPFLLWRTPHFALDRLGNVPHQLLQTLIFLWLAIIYFRKIPTGPASLVLIIVLAIALTTLNPAQAAIFVAVAAITEFITFLRRQKIDLLKLACLGAPALLTFIYINQIFHTLPHLQALIWDAAQQDKTDLPFLLLSMGPISFLALLGLPFVDRRKPIFLFTAVLPLIAYVLFLSPLPQLVKISNLRVIFPALYPFLGALAALATEKLSKLSFVKASRRVLVSAIIVITFFVLSFPTLLWEVGQRLAPANTDEPKLYISKNIYAGFVFLKNRKAYNDVVLGNHTTGLDLLIPALSGHTTYSGHDLLTINSGEKNRLATEFFSLVITDPRGWLFQNRIKYVIFSQNDGDISLFQKTYSFLKPVYQNPEVTVFNVIGK